jgi:biopolymer transport protein ExbD
MIRYRARKISAVIPTASMADIAFLMITFFMYTTTFSVDRTEVILPESFIRQLVEKDAAIIAITARGEINVSDGVRESEPAATPEALEQTVGHHPVAQPPVHHHATVAPTGRSTRCTRSCRSQGRDISC